jgi:hypothetical protein
MSSELPSPAQQAYALLWRSKTGDHLINQARRLLSAAMTKEEQRDAIAWVLAEVGPMTDAEMVAADMRVGVFPRRSFAEPGEQAND